jgi:glutamyl-tRNA(Gln) amidotransferase subunit D
VINAEVKIESQFVKMDLTNRHNNYDVSYSKKPENNFEVMSKFDPNVALIKYYPGIDPNLIKYAVKTGCRAIVFEGTGLGHVGRKLFPEIAKAIKSGVLIFMTSQCIWGRLNMKVYDTGRDLIELGVIPLEDMTSEAAVVKAMWAMANGRDNIEAAKIMERNIANEISLKSPINRRMPYYGKD